MKTYVADVIPRIQKFSQKLDNLSLLMNHHWVVLDEITNSKTVYIFRSNSELLIAINGKVEKAKWEYLGQDSILIDFKDDSYLLRHGFFDDNILALKIDSKQEYVFLINENSYNKDLNSIFSVINFLEENYQINSIINNLLGRQNDKVTKVITFKRQGYTIKMGAFTEFLVSFSNGIKISIYQKISNKKYFVYEKDKINLFPTEETCLNYIEEQML